MAERTIHHSLVRPLQLGGVPRNAAIMNATMTAVLIDFAFNLGMPWVLAGCVAVGIFTHSLMARAVKNDAKCIEAYIRHIGYGKYYPARAHPRAPSAKIKKFKIGSGS